MSYFLFYPPLALPADILSCNSPVTWRAMEAEDIERNRVCLGIKRASWEDLGEYTGSSMCLFFDDDDSLFCELGGVFSPLLFPPFLFHHEAASLIGARLFCSVGHTSWHELVGKTFFFCFLFFSPPKCELLTPTSRGGICISPDH